MIVYFQTTLNYDDFAYVKSLEGMSS